MHGVSLLHKLIFYQGSFFLCNLHTRHVFWHFINTKTHNSSFGNAPMYNPRQFTKLKDYGPAPIVVNIEEATQQNTNFLTALWTGNYLQLTLMSINVGEDIGLKIHPNLDQFVRIEEGQGLVMIGDSKDNLNFQRKVFDDYVFIIPVG